MFDKITRFDSQDDSVCKYVFESENAVAEAVLYKYNRYYDRTVICCSVQSGCPVGCVFCGTGKKFIRNLTSEEIIQQVDYVLKNKGLYNINQAKRFQIMFMSMGEPMLNWDEVEKSIKILHKIYPNAELLISTIGVNNVDVFNRIINISKEIKNVGLQFSIHESNDYKRDKLIPFVNKFKLKQIRDLGSLWWKETGRKPFLNYCINPEHNDSSYDRISLMHLFSPLVFNFTFSVICESNETIKYTINKNLDTLKDFAEQFQSEGYNVRMFNPAGQDDIGGGCGQLWYVQKWMKENVK